HSVAGKSKILGEAGLKASCLWKCDPLFRKPSVAHCPNRTDTDCDKLVGDSNSGLKCALETGTLVVNGVAIRKAVKCHTRNGWTDTENNKAIIDFTQIDGEPVFEYYCHENCAESSWKIGVMG
ncbi:hypothetical protein PFISCL1PPCAC_16781, partial [Pristionchus fissidentatus]